MDNSQKDIANMDYETCRKIFDVNPSTGEIYWRPRTLEMFSHCKFPKRAFKVWTKNWSGKRALKTANNEMYLSGEYLGVSYKSHQIIWLYVNRCWPDNIDHIDGNRQNNSIENLRNVTKAENARNQKRRKDNSSGFTGVYWREDKQMWQGGFRYNKKQQHVGYFESLEECVKEVKRQREEKGFHKNHGRNQ